MKLLLALLFFVFAHCSHAQSHSGSDILQSAIDNLPPCALQCTLVTVGSSACELTDFGCIKNNEELLHDLTACVKSSCSIRNALTAKKFLQQMMGAPVRDNRTVGNFTCLIIGGVAVLAYIIRATARLPIFGGNWGLDDWVITAAVILIIPLTICAYLLNEKGVGTDMWMVPFENITKVLEIFYFTELIYLTAIALTKISVLLFYLRLFPHKQLRRTIYLTIVLCILYIIGFVIATALQCLPVHLAWDHWDGEHHGHCINLNALAWASAGVNIILDIIVIIIPMRELKNLAMSRRRKFGVMLMFLGGGFVTIVSVLRLKYLIQFAHTENVTWDYLHVGVWSAVEADVGVIIACLPAIRALYSSIQGRLFPKAPATTSYYEDHTKDSSKKNTQLSTFRKWTSKQDRLSTISRTKVDKEEFVLLDEFDTRGRSPGENSLERSPSRSCKSNEDIEPLKPAAPTYQPARATRVHIMLNGQSHPNMI